VAGVIEKKLRLPNLKGELITTHFVGPKNGKLEPRLSEAMTDLISELIAQGATLSQISLLPEMPSAIQIQRWIKTDTEFSEKIEYARKARAEFYADIAATVAAKTTSKNAKQNRLKVDTLKWRAGCDDPDRYGQRTKITGDAEKPLTFLLDTGFRTAESEAEARPIEIHSGDPTQLTHLLKSDES
jgi:hypothetical protein